MVLPPEAPNGLSVKLSAAALFELSIFLAEMIEAVLPFSALLSGMYLVLCLRCLRSGVASSG